MGDATKLRVLLTTELDEAERKVLDARRKQRADAESNRRQPSLRPTRPRRQLKRVVSVCGEIASLDSIHRPRRMAA